MSIQEPQGPSESVQRLCWKILKNQKAINDAQPSPLPVSIETPAAGFPISYADSPSIGAFARLRISESLTIFDSSLTSDEQPLLWVVDETGTGTGTQITQRSAFELEVSASGDRVIRQTKQFFRYQPGKSQLILMTFAMEEDANVRTRVGYFETENGIFLERDGSTVNLVIRSNATGIVVEERVPQANWNVDTFENLDLDKIQIFAIDIEWLGVGRVRCGFVVDGIFRYAHYFNHANTSAFAGPYMRTALLPCRYEIEATGVPSAATSLLEICCSIVSEGGQEDETGFPFAVRNTASVASAAAVDRPVLSIRPKALFGGFQNRAGIKLRNLSITPDAGVIGVDIYFGGVLTGPVWTSVDANSTVEYDQTATAIAGGTRIGAGVIFTSVGSRGSLEANIQGNLPWGLDVAGANPSQITIAMTDIGTNANVWASMGWQEYR